MSKVPINRQVNTGDLRAHYVRGEYSFGNPAGKTTICIVGSCRITPILNYFRAYNHLCGSPFHILVFNPVEFWDGPGTDVGECVTKKLKDYRFGHVDYLICESLKLCGVLNTFDDIAENIFGSLGCSPGTILRIPNWRAMLFYDSEIGIYNEEYRNLSHDLKIESLRERESECRNRFVKYCELSSFPDLPQWVKDVWLKKRLGWTIHHVHKNLSWKFFELICRSMNLEITSQLASHQFCTSDVYSENGTQLTPLDYEANHWEYR